MKARLVSIMLWAPGEWSDEEVANELRDAIGYCIIPCIEDRPIFAKAITIAPDAVEWKARVIFAEDIRPEGEGRGE